MSCHIQGLQKPHQIFIKLRQREHPLAEQISAELGRVEVG